jgi:hypothetical protein
MGGCGVGWIQFQCLRGSLLSMIDNSNKMIAVGQSIPMFTENHDGVKFRTMRRHPDCFLQGLHGVGLAMSLGAASGGDMVEFDFDSVFIESREDMVSFRRLLRSPKPSSYFNRLCRPGDHLALPHLPH